MFATDFIFDSQRLSDFGCMICSFDGDFQTASGGEIEYNVVKAPNRDKFSFYGAEFNTVLTWNYSICKNTCSNNDNMYFDQYEESMLAKWLIKTDGYRYFQFDQEGYEDIFYNVYINMLPHQVAGRTVGYDLTVTSDCGYGYSDEITKIATVNSSAPLKFNINNDISTVVYPHIQIKGSGDFIISNDNDSLYEISDFRNVSTTIIMDCENDIIEGLNSPNDFNWYFIRLVDGMNTITTNSTSNIQIEIKYREARRVIV